MRFFNPTKIVYGPGKLNDLSSILRDEIRAKEPFLVTDAGIRSSGLLDQALSQFENITVFDAVEQNPRHSTVNRGGEIIRRIKPDVVIALGGGSVLDAAKAIALLATNPGNIEDYEGKGKYNTAPLPVCAIPTTCGTGSEVTWVAVITNTERRFKMSIKGPLMFPAVALVDPDLLITLPPPLVASTGMDALTHAVEGFTVKGATVLTDVFALESVRYIFKYIERAYKDIVGDKEAREGLMLGSLLAGMSFGNSDVGAVHCIAESIGSMYDTPHGVANAVFLPFVMEFNLPACQTRFAKLASAAGLSGGDELSSAANLIERVRELSSALGIPQVTELGIADGDLAEIARKSFENNSTPSNPRDVSADDYAAIISRALRS
ncbi:iron-containing alcohol dehydrogenase [Acidobacteriota bacterium]